MVTQLICILFGILLYLFLSYSLQKRLELEIEIMKLKDKMTQQRAKYISHNNALTRQLLESQQKYSALESQLALVKIGEEQLNVSILRYSEISLSDVLTYL